MVNYKTTLTSLVAVIVGFATYKGWINADIGSAVTALALALFGYLAKDKDVSGKF